MLLSLFLTLTLPILYFQLYLSSSLAVFLLLYASLSIPSSVYTHNPLYLCLQPYLFLYQIKSESKTNCLSVSLQSFLTLPITPSPYSFLTVKLSPPFYIHITLVLFLSLPHLK